MLGLFMDEWTDFWNGKTVLVTGHTGFKGSWLSLWLQQMQSKVIGFSLEPPTTPNLFTDASVAQNMVDIRGDVRNLPALQAAIELHRPEIIFHMAAQPLVRYSYRHPVETYMTNVMGTIHMLEAARQVSSMCAIINVTTDKCYENKEWEWGYREHDQLGGHDPYSGSKACAELASASYRRSFLMKPQHHPIGLATARAGNVIGGGDWTEGRLLPDLMKHCQMNQTVELRNPHAIRSWQHVLEPLFGYLLLAQKLYENPNEYSEAWNFGSHEQDMLTVAEVATRVFTYWDREIKWTSLGEDTLHETIHLRLDSSKARKRLGWKPRWNVDQALQETVEWYRSYFARLKSIREMTLEQIEQFLFCYDRSKN